MPDILVFDIGNAIMIVYAVMAAAFFCMRKVNLLEKLSSL